MRYIEIIENVNQDRGLKPSYENWHETYENGITVIRVTGDDGNDRPPQYLYRVMSIPEFENAKRVGEFRPKPGERIHASNRPLPQHGSGNAWVAVKIEYRDEDGWRAKWGDELYAVTNNSIPFSLATVVQKSGETIIETTIGTTVPLADTAKNEISRADWFGTHIAYMSPDEYIALARKVKFNRPPFPTNLNGNLDKLRASIEQNGLRALPWLKLDGDQVVSQEGMHRATVLKTMGYKRIPVRIFAVKDKNYLDRDGAKETYLTIMNKNKEQLQ